MAGFFSLAKIGTEKVIITSPHIRVTTTDISFPKQDDGSSCGIAMYSCVPRGIVVHFQVARTAMMEGILKGNIEWNFISIQEAIHLHVLVQPPAKVELTRRDEVKITCFARGTGNLKYEWVKGDGGTAESIQHYMAQTSKKKRKSFIVK